MTTAARELIGERVSRATMTALVRGRGLDPGRLRPALRRQDGRGETYWVRCWVLVDELGEVQSPVGMGMRRRRGQGCAEPYLVVGRPRHFYELEEAR